MRLIDGDALQAEYIEAYGKRLLLIDTAPTIERKKGYWIGEGDGYADGEIVYDTWYCSECDHDEDGEFSALPNFCPNCGADMREEEQDG